MRYFSGLAIFASAAWSSLLGSVLFIVFVDSLEKTAAGNWSWTGAAEALLFALAIGPLAVLYFVIPVAIGVTVVVFFLALLFDRFGWQPNTINALLTGAALGAVVLSIMAVAGDQPRNSIFIVPLFVGSTTGGISGLLYLYVLKYLGRVS